MDCTAAAARRKRQARTGRERSSIVFGDAPHVAQIGEVGVDSHSTIELSESPAPDGPFDTEQPRERNHPPDGPHGVHGRF